MKDVEYTYVWPVINKMRYRNSPDYEWTGKINVRKREVKTVKYTESPVIETALCGVQLLVRVEDVSAERTVVRSRLI